MARRRPRRRIWRTLSLARGRCAGHRRTANCRRRGARWRRRRSRRSPLVRAPTRISASASAPLIREIEVGGGGLRDKIVDSSIRFDQLIKRGNKRELRVSTARKLEVASGEDLADVLRGSSASALRGSYYDPQLAQDRVAISADTAELHRHSLQAADLRLKAGDIASSDVARIRVDALRAQNDAGAAEADRRRAQLALAYLIGTEHHADLLKATDAWPAPQPAAAADLDELIERRPDVRAARSRIEAAGPRATWRRACEHATHAGRAVRSLPGESPVCGDQWRRHVEHLQASS